MFVDCKSTTSTTSGFSLGYNINNKWYKSGVGISFFCLTVFCFLYSTSVLYTINKLLNDGAGYSRDDFQTKYGVKRGDMINLQSIFIALTIISTAIFFYFIVSVIPHNIQCILFNQYAMLVFILFVLVISSWVQSSVSSKNFSSKFVKILNLIALIVSVLVLFAIIVLVIYSYRHVIKAKFHSNKKHPSKTPQKQIQMKQMK